MSLESITHIDDLVVTNPTASDPKSEGDDHIRGIKTALKTDFPDITGPMTATQTELNVLDGSEVVPATTTLVDGDGVVISDGGVTTQCLVSDFRTFLTTSTKAELDIMDGSTSAIATTVNAADRVVYNDAGLMKQVAMSDLLSFFTDGISFYTGKVDTAGTMLHKSNAGLSSTRNAVGDFTITHNLGSTQYTAFAFQQNSSGGDDVILRGAAQSANSCQFVFTDIGATATDVQFAFLILAY